MAMMYFMDSSFDLEIIQELSQPVTVMIAATQMIAAGYLGPVNRLAAFATE